MKPTTDRAGVRLTALPAACGDCLIVEYGTPDRPRRILIDGGLGSKYDIGLGAWLSSAPAPMHFDIVVCTHVDRDHIDGIIRALRDVHLVADDIWFNGRDQIDALVNGDGPDGRGVRQGDELDRLIPPELRNRVVDHGAIHVPDTGPTTHDVAGARITLLSPIRPRLERLLNRWPEPADDTDEPDEATDRLLDAFEDPAARGEGEFGEDSSAANGSSIAFLLEIGDVALLLTGDAYAGDLEAALRQVLGTRGLPRLRVDLFKLSHHGSRQNVTDELLELVDPAAILVCTDGSKFRHPDADALEKVRASYPAAVVHFTDDDGVNAHIRQRAALVGSAPLTTSPLRLEF